MKKLTKFQIAKMIDNLNHFNSFTNENYFTRQELVDIYNRRMSELNLGLNPIV